MKKDHLGQLIHGVLFVRVISFFKRTLKINNRRKGGILQDDLSIALRKIYLHDHKNEDY